MLGQPCLNPPSLTEAQLWSGVEAFWNPQDPLMSVSGLCRLWNETWSQWKATSSLNGSRQLEGVSESYPDPSDFGFHWKLKETLYWFWASFWSPQRLEIRHTQPLQASECIWTQPELSSRQVWKRNRKLQIYWQVSLSAGVPGSASVEKEGPLYWPNVLETRDWSGIVPLCNLHMVWTLTGL